jgi:hypothetical protein
MGSHDLFVGRNDDEIVIARAVRKLWLWQSLALLQREGVRATASQRSLEIVVSRHDVQLRPFGNA